MKLMFLLSVFGVVASTHGYYRGCQYVMGKCVHECEEGTHGYGSDCNLPFYPEPTCKMPLPTAQLQGICDFSACYCDPPTVRDISTGKCVALDKCPKDLNTPYMQWQH